MADVDNSSLGAPPLATPITATGADQFGVPYQHRPDGPVPAGNLAISWASWFGRLFAQVQTFLQQIAQIFVMFTKDVYLQCNQADLPTTLGPGDAGFIAEVMDYNHRLMWNGTGWQWAWGENGSGYMQIFEVDPAEAWWQPYNGSTVDYLKSDGTLGTVILPDVESTPADYTYLKLGPAGSSAAVAPTAVMSGNTAPNFTGISLGLEIVEAFATNAVGAATGGYTDPGHQHGASGLICTINTDTELQNLQRRPFFRR